MFAEPVCLQIGLVVSHSLDSPAADTPFLHRTQTSTDGQQLYGLIMLSKPVKYFVTVRKHN